MTDAPFVIPFADVEPGDGARVGGKGANLGVLARAGFPVPAGVCVTTRAYERFVAPLRATDALWSALDRLDGKDAQAARAAAEAMRAAMAALPVPDGVADEVASALGTLGGGAYAVRSSATAEDLPGASFAGQQDTFLNVSGAEAIVDAVRKCWISLFTDRAVLYRARTGFGHRSVALAVVIQRLVEPDVSGILFTADPVSGHRGTISIDAGFGLGEALVGGLVNADLYRVDRKSRTVTLARPGKKAFAIRSDAAGGTRRQELSPERESARCLDDAAVLELAALGERVEQHYGGVPQDIEWCFEAKRLHLLQARPITSLFPLREPPGDGLRAYVSFGHFQMFLDPMPRLAREIIRMLLPPGKKWAPTLRDAPTLAPLLVEAGGRIFLDVTPAMRVPRMRAIALGVLGVLYADLARGLSELVRRPGLAEHRGAFAPMVLKFARVMAPVGVRVPPLLLVRDAERAAAWADTYLETLVARKLARMRAPSTLAGRLRQGLRELSSGFGEIRPALSRLMGGVLSHRLLLALTKRPWAEGVRGHVDTLLRGLPWNVTTQMDLAVGDLADLARPFPALAAELRGAPATLPWATLRGQFVALEGGAELVAGMDRFLERYGDRGAGEIDISRSRWSEDPRLLVRVVAGSLSREAPPGAHRAHHQAQVAAGEGAAERIALAARKGPLGFVRGWWVRRLCRLARHGQGLREHPKFAMIRIMGALRREILAAGDLLASRGQIDARDDVFHLGADELSLAVDTPGLEVRTRIAERRAALEHDRRRKPPAVFSSEGESPVLDVDRSDLPDGALPGTAASAGVVEGVARVIRDPNGEVLHAGEILVAPFTDPGWTPLFVNAAGVVTEVGGLMTHGAVVAREYGIPAVVSVAGALDHIRTGQRVRVDGTRGFVQILEAP